MTLVLHAHEVDNSRVRVIERASIRAFVESCSEQLRGSVLDIGAGEQPYREIVERAGGQYVPYDAPSFPASLARRDTTGEAWGKRFDTLLCNQVVQYVEEVVEMLRRHRADHLNRGGFLVLTYPTNWAEVEPEDLHRFTCAGMGRILSDAGFTALRHERRAEINLGGFVLPIGYGVLARAAPPRPRCA